MADCNIVKRADFSSMQWDYAGKTNKTKFGKSWYGKCPECGKLIKGGAGYHYRYSYRNTRKAAKDALNYHMKHEH